MKFKTYDGVEWSAGCTWGDGPDVAINIKVPEKYATIIQNQLKTRDIFLDLTAEEAQKLGHALVSAGDKAAEIEEGYYGYLKAEQEDIDKAAGNYVPYEIIGP